MRRAWWHWAERTRAGRGLAGAEGMAEPFFVGEDGKVWLTWSEGAEGGEFVGVVGGAGGVGVDEIDGVGEGGAEAGAGGREWWGRWRGGEWRQRADPGVFKLEGVGGGVGVESQGGSGFGEEEAGAGEVEGAATALAVGIRRGEDAKAGEGGFKEGGGRRHQRRRRGSCGSIRHGRGARGGARWRGRACRRSRRQRDVWRGGAVDAEGVGDMAGHDGGAFGDLEGEFWGGFGWWRRGDQRRRARRGWGLCWWRRRGRFGDRR